MNKHQRFFEIQLDSKNQRGRRFHNLTRSVANKCGKDGLIYSNLFCFDWNKGSPIHSPYFEVIKKYSEALLKIQLRILEPEIIIFANGITSVPHRREFFPIHGDNQVCTNGRDYSSEGIANHHLWEFDLYKNIRCFRIHHPSTRTKEAAKARQFLINLLPSA
jgi:uracil-DNA glycosylase